MLPQPARDPRPPRPAAGSAPPSLLTPAHRHLDGRTLEPEGLAQPALDEPAVAGLDEPRGEDHEARRAGRCLRRIEDARLLPAAHGVRVGGDELTEEGVEPARGDARLPRVER